MSLSPIPLYSFYTEVQYNQRLPKITKNSNQGEPALRQDPPLDLSFWSFLTFFLPQILKELTLSEKRNHINTKSYWK